ncbi:MAG: hypothetical protein GF307_01985 [candidate division Zixibacteria bacterium]|nr:hypothetical protein [candidate division Zixibacteria bacterium]
MRKLLLLAIVFALAIPSASLAKDMEGKYGLGYFMQDAPVGARYWVNSNIGIDFGVGFESQDQGDESATSFYVELGVPYVLIDTERANFMLRPGFTYGSLDARPYGINSDEKWTQMTITLMPVAEVFFGEHFSLEAGHGIKINMRSYPDDSAFGALADESFTDIETFGASVTYLGFHFYFK